MEGGGARGGYFWPGFAEGRGATGSQGS